MDTFIRRIVTGKNAGGKAVVIADGPAANIQFGKGSGTTNILLWATECSPADLHNFGDAADRSIGLQPPVNGTVFRIVEFLPEKDVSGDYATRLQLMRARGMTPEGDSRDAPRHPSMHRTKTLDYVLVLSGEIDMLLDDSEVHLRAGDVVVQQACNHAWVNRGDQPCRIAFVMIDANDARE